MPHRIGWRGLMMVLVGHTRALMKCIFLPEVGMTITNVFQSGNSQAVRIPREFQFDVAEVEIERHGDEIVLRPPVTCRRLSLR
jgi:hypothetical protein